MEMENQAYPVTLRGELTIPPARGWWLIKWLLAIPHWFILFFLSIAFAVVWIIAFFSILFTGKYPKSLFEFNAGVLRWYWRVGFYCCQVLGTDKYPPFTLQPRPDYPADLEIDYPERLSHGLVVVKWWLLAIPHWIVFYILICWPGGNGPDRIWEAGRWHMSGGDGGPGLIFVLALFAGIALLFTGKYPKEIFKLVIGFNRWVYRFLAYVSLMTDKYPPFRLWDD